MACSLLAVRRPGCRAGRSRPRDVAFWGGVGLGPMGQFVRVTLHFGEGQRAGRSTRARFWRRLELTQRVVMRIKDRDWREYVLS
jgi:hypothetical protein